MVAYWGASAAIFLPAAIVIGELHHLSVTGLVASGLLSWTFAEYAIHRWLMHRDPLIPKWDKVVERSIPHRTHHRKPEAPDIAIIERPLKPLSMCIVFAFALSVLIPWPHAGSYALGTGLGYFLYEAVHFSTHKCKMDNPVGRYLMRHHMLHHYADPTRNYGVTTPIWDFIFATYYRPKDAPATKSPHSGGAAAEPDAQIGNHRRLTIGTRPRVNSEDHT
ncbi:sterol desaturase family protein [Roseibium sp. RKSG952]|uniref:sterol desaturase family protein n=1 Tax=Roseibium sp. RKSG952 TaxID=2529384 RepID=UPI0012BC093F|nr:sterol desaturase family protein [Roseibium sp. RKSG952]MTH97267.1 hypothetical protein [Roseibium sp. RKSG952]